MESQGPLQRLRDTSQELRELGLSGSLFRLRWEVENQIRMRMPRFGLNSHTKKEIPTLSQNIDLLVPAWQALISH